MIHSRCSTAEEMMRLGRELAKFAKPDDCIVLNGDLGAGKTQFAKGYAEGLGVDDDVTSPTFNILFEYVGDELPLLHFDLYRLEQESELADIDFYGLLESGGVSLVEWGDKFEHALPEDRLDITIRILEDGERDVSLLGRGSRGCELEEAFQSTEL